MNPCGLSFSKQLLPHPHFSASAAHAPALSHATTEWSVRSCCRTPLPLSKQFCSVSVVVLPFCRISEYRVGLAYVLKPLPCFEVRIHIRVIAERQLPVCSFYFLLSGVAGDFKKLIIVSVAFCHVLGLMEVS